LVPTIESILQQDYPNIECNVVDGGSTDDTIEVLRCYKERIKWVSEPDNGSADAINKGWRMSKGEILAWLNADDVWVVPDAVSKVVAYLEAHPEVDVVYGDCGAIDVEGNLIGMSYVHEWDLEYAVKYCDHCIPQPAAFIRRRILEKVGWLDANFIIMDKDLWYRIGLIGTIRYVPILLAHARSHTSFWHSKSYLVAADCVQIINKFFDNPDLPIKFRNIRPRAISNSYLRGIYYAWVGRHWKTVFSYALRATVADPTNARSAFRCLRGYVVRGLRENSQSRWADIALTSLYLPARVLRKVKNWLKGVDRPSIPNLLGDRDIEWSWVTSQIPSGCGEALDFGPGGGHLGLVAARRGFSVTAVDLEPVEWPYVDPRLRFIRGDILKIPLPKEHFDVIINCSTVEHVGLAGRYGVTENRTNGDLEAMARLKELMKGGGVMLLTIPLGRDAVFAPLCRVYGEERLPRLLDGYTVKKEEFWVKDQENRWVLCDRETALKFKAAAGSSNPLQSVYALGCFVLKKPERERPGDGGISPTAY
jgi:glycosyltransferase involved in cell wall biosynthesis